MMDVLFVTTTEKSTLKCEVNGTMLLATKLLQAGFSVDVLRFSQINSYGVNYEKFICNITMQILRISPKCVSFYTLWPYFHIVLRVACELKKHAPEMLIVMGGPQASATAAATMAAMNMVDYVCTGEGESTVVPFFKAVLEKREEKISEIPGLYYRKNGNVFFNDIEVPLCDLNTLPQWDERLLMNAREKIFSSETYFMPIDVGRGCPFGCTFCSTGRFWRSLYRMKSPERIVEDMEYFNQKFGIRSFFFSHDAFTTNQRLVTEICDYILSKGLDIRWECTSRIDCLSKELVLKMKQAGMIHISLGVETGSKRMQKIVNKNLNLDKAKETIAFLLENDIHVSLFFMYGFPEETEEDVNETLELLFTLIDMGVQQTSMSFCRFNPATQITKEYYDELVFDPEIKVQFRGVFGIEEEMQLIRQNKEIFPFFYHLNTKVRKEYQYLIIFTYWYEQFPRSIGHLRKLYNGDNLQFYKDFYNQNKKCFEEPIDKIVAHIINQGWDVMLNILKKHDVPYMEQLQAVLKFNYDLKRISSSKEDVTHREIYNFNYLDYKRKQPIERYSDSKTEILLQKTNGKVNMRILSMK